jgi:tRNA pseudouridine13 synthase
MHGGNYFTLTLRDLQPEDSADDVAVVAASATSELFARGFINYFGLQRFGNNPRAPTHEVGAAILRSDFSAAIRLLLDPGPLCSAELREALASFERTGDTSAALAALHPNYTSAERTLLKSLREQPTDLVGAIMKLPRNLRTLYVHALQSSCFNHAASERVRLYGCEKVVAGDLVCTDSATTAQASPAAQAGEAGLHQPADGVANNEDEEPTAPAEERLSSLKAPHIVSVEEAASGKYTIDDVVLPVPGTDVIYPQNDVSAEYDRHLATHGLVRGSFAHRVRHFRLRGDYRRLLQRPSDFEWRIERYDDPTEPLVQTDVARLRGEPPRPRKASGERTALIICFTLPASSYATMLIRELTKQKTDKEHQIALNVTDGAVDATAANVALGSDGAAPTIDRDTDCLES